MEQIIIEILKNAKEPVYAVLNNITEFVKAMEVATSERIYFKQAVFEYYTERGHQRKRVMKNTYEIWVQRDVEDLQEESLMAIKLKKLFQ